MFVFYKDIKIVNCGFKLKLMGTLKNILTISIITFLVYSCDDNDSANPAGSDFDHAAQAVKDNDSLVLFLKNHFYDKTEDLVKPLEDGKTALFDHPDLHTQEVTDVINDKEIDFKLYVYTAEKGSSRKGNPTVVDSVLVNYSGYKVLNTKTLDGTEFDNNNNTWFVLGASTIRGWSYGVPNFKGGTNITLPDEPLAFENPGKGVIFIPSGLAYRNQGIRDILPNEILMFYIQLNDVVTDTDSDRDGVPSISEDPDGDGIPWNDDIDDDGVPNFLDIDDDGDLILTINEDTNKDGNPANDFNDPNKPNTPDYLNPDIRKSNE